MEGFVTPLRQMKKGSFKNPTRNEINKSNVLAVQLLTALTYERFNGFRSFLPFPFHSFFFFFFLLLATAGMFAVANQGERKAPGSVDSHRQVERFLIG